MYLNKYDVLLVVFVLLGALSGIFYSIKGSGKVNYAYVYYQNKEVLKINLKQKSSIYRVDGKKGEVVIEAGEGKIRVIEENSPIHLCSKQGYIQNPHERIICLPNQVVIELSSDEFDTTVR